MWSAVCWMLPDIFGRDGNDPVVDVPLLGQVVASASVLNWGCFAMPHSPASPLPVLQVGTGLGMP